MYCPSCGNEIRKLNLKSISKYMPLSDTFECKKCKKELVVEDVSYFDQENYIEIVFH